MAGLRLPVSPNVTLTLAEVPTRMGGAAGGAVQTGQRIGASIGAAVVMSTYQLALSSYDDPESSVVAEAHPHHHHHQPHES